MIRICRHAKKRTLRNRRRNVFLHHLGSCRTWTSSSAKESHRRLNHEPAPEQQFQVGTSVIPPVVIDVVDLSSWWYWEAIQIHPQLLVEVFLVPGCWHIDGPVPASQVLRKWVLSHIQRNIICQAPIQQDPAHMNSPPNLWGTSNQIWTQLRKAKVFIPWWPLFILKA